MKVKDSIPPVRWEDGRTLITTLGGPEQNFTARYLLQFSSDSGNNQGMIIVLDFYMSKKRMLAKSFSLKASGDVVLQDVCHVLVYLEPKHPKTNMITSGETTVMVTLLEEEITDGCILSLNLSRSPTQLRPNLALTLQVETELRKWSFMDDLRRQEQACFSADSTCLRHVDAVTKLESMRKLIDEIEEKERQLAEEKARIEEDMSRVRQNVTNDQVLRGHITEKKHLEDEKARQQKILDETEGAHGPGNWFATLIQERLDRYKEPPKNHEVTNKELTWPVDRGHNMANFVPLAWAAANGKDIIAKLLLEKGADVETAGQGDTTALWLAAAFGHTSMAKLLIERGALLESRDKYGYTPLATSASKGHAGTTALLLERNADIEARSKNLNTPLTIASRQGHTMVVKMLLKHGADHAIRNHWGETPLIRAIQHGQVDVVRMLLEAGAKTDDRDKNGITPIQMAINCGYDGIAKLLQN
ncbi:hypothetical protein ACHAP5_011002 [Fusarium lateritium]